MIFRSACLCFLTALSALSAEPDFAALAKQADRYQLPTPPKGAKLVLGNTGWTTCVGNSSTALDPGIYQAGFLLPDKVDKKPVILAGFSKLVCDSDREHRPATRRFTTKPPKPALGGYGFRANSLTTFEVAVQCARRGDLKTAKALYGLYNKSEYKDGFFTQEPTRQYDPNPSLLLARATYGYYYYRVLTPEADLKHCLNRLEELRKEFPSLFSTDKEQYSAHYAQKFLDDLRLTANAAPPAAGSIEELLFQSAGSDVRVREVGPGHPRYKIYMKGVSAIPELVRLTTSQKLTRKVNPGIMNARETRARLGQIAKSVLDSMVGSHFATHHQFDGQRRDQRDWKKWLKQVDLKNEKQFFTDATKPSKGEKNDFSASVPLMILVTKYPETMQPTAEKLSQTDHRSELIQVIMRSKASKEAKIKALKTLYQTQKGMTRRFMLQNLAQLDAQAASLELLPLIQQLPKDVNKPYWTCAEAHLTHVVMQIEDDAIWKSYLAKAKTSAIGLRMEVMNPMNYTYIGDKNRQRGLAFLAAFLDDKETRKVTKSSRWDGPHAGFTYDILSVQNFVTEKIASILDVPGQPSEFWKPKQWAAYRAKVQQALAKEKLPDF